MKIKLLNLPLIALLACIGHSASASDFKMIVEEVDLLQGFIMRGISLTGTVAKGCLANDDKYNVMRKDKEVLEETTRIVNIEGLKNGESFTGKTIRGDYVSLFIPDGKEGIVKVGDVVIGKNTSCEDPTAKKPIAKQPVLKMSADKKMADKKAVEDKSVKTKVEDNKAIEVKAAK